MSLIEYSLTEKDLRFILDGMEIEKEHNIETDLIS